MKTEDFTAQPFNQRPSKVVPWYNVQLRKRAKGLNECECCEASFFSEEVQLSLYYIVPPAKGGDMKPENLLLLCQDCGRKLTDNYNKI